MEADGAGLMRAASNDGGLGEWDGMTLEERSEGSGGEGRGREIFATQEGVKKGVTEGERIKW